MKRPPVLLLGATVALSALLTVRLPGWQASGEVQIQQNMQAYFASRTAGYSTRTSFAFGVFSDIHVTETSTGVLTRLQWQNLLTNWRDRGDLFGIIVGDLGFGADTHIANVLSGPAAVPGAPPIFYSMGNHELDVVGKRPWVDALYPGAVPPASWTNNLSLPPGNADHLYWSFNVGPSTHFIMLDGDFSTFDVVQRRWQTFGQNQLAWLESDIRANADKNILVFVHEPIDQQATGFAPQLTLNDKGALLDLLALHPKQKFVFSGHLHNHGGITTWKGVTSVHVQVGVNPAFGVRVAVNGETITITGPGTSTVTNFDAHPMNATVTIGGQQVLRVAEDGASAGVSNLQKMFPVGPENGVTPTSGSMMLKADAMTWYSPRFVSEQLVKIVPGMKFSYDIYLFNVVGGMDAVTLNPDWAVKDGTLPAVVLDQNWISASRRSKDGRYFNTNEDTPTLGGRASGRWYHREFDLSDLAGSYVDGLYLSSAAGKVNVGAIYVDDIRFTWPAPGTILPPSRINHALASRGAVATASSNYNVNFPASGVIDGDRRGLTWGAGGAWIDGTSNIYPDWLEVNFGGVKTINELNVITAQDAYATPLDPSPTMTFSLHGLRDFEVQYWNGSTFVTVPGAVVTANNLVWRRFTFSPISTSRIRLFITNALNLFSRVVELEAYGPSTASNAPPIVAVTSPANGASFVSPASLTLTANASDSDGSVTSVAFYVNGGLVGTDTTNPYSIPWSSSALGAYTVTAVVTDNLGATTTSAPVNISVTAGGGGGGTSATFVGTDTTTQGNWRGVYGGDGYRIAYDATADPGYATVTMSGHSSYPWTESTTDVRALQRASGSGRLAAMWYGYSYDINLNLTGGDRQVALYTIDWDGWGRSQRFDVLDATTLAVLDSRTISGFQGGRYLRWSTAGSVKIRVTLLAGPNAVVSGLFFSPTGGGNQAPAVTLTSPANGASFPAGSTVNLAATASDADGTVSSVEFRANGTLLNTDVSAPFAFAWPSVPAGSYSLTAVARDNLGAPTTSAPVSITVTAGNQPPTVALTSPANGASVVAGSTVNLAATASDADGTVSSVESRANGTLLNTDVSAPFAFAWLSVPAGSYSLTAVARDNLGAPTTSASVNITVTAGSGTTATFVGTDTTTQGNWQGVYGGSGYHVVYDAASYPAYATLMPSGHSSYPWTESTSDVRALRRVSGSGRLAAAWYGSVFDINMTVTGGAHQVALYIVDWDSWGRSQRFEVLDGTTLAVLDSRTVNNFQGGQYLRWMVTGNVKIRVTLLAGPNAVVCAVFFGTTSGTEALPLALTSPSNGGSFTASAAVSFAASASDWAALSGVFVPRRTRLSWLSAAADAGKD